MGEVIISEAFLTPLSPSENYFEVSPSEERPDTNGKEIFPSLPFTSLEGVSKHSHQKTAVEAIPQMMKYLLGLWLPPFLLLEPSPCSSTPLIFYLTLMQQPQWSGTTLDIPPHHCIIFIFHCDPLLVILFLCININDLGRHFIFLPTTALFSFIKWPPLFFFSSSYISFEPSASNSMFWVHNCPSYLPLYSFSSSTVPLSLFFFSNSIPFDTFVSTSMVWGDTCSSSPPLHSFTSSYYSYLLLCFLPLTTPSRFPSWLGGGGGGQIS